MSSETNVEVPSTEIETVKGKAGHPGKKGTLENLLKMTFESVPSAALEQIRLNLNNNIGNPQVFRQIQKTHKVDDVELILNILNVVNEKLYGGSPQVSTN